MTPQNDKLKSIIEEFEEQYADLWEGDENLYNEFKTFLVFKLTEYGASERVEGAKEERALRFYWTNGKETKEIPLMQQKDFMEANKQAHAAGREEAIKIIETAVASWDKREETDEKNAICVLVNEIMAALKADKNESCRDYDYNGVCDKPNHKH